MDTRAPPTAAEFRFYEELNDFLAPALRKRSFSRAIHGTPSVKDAIEAIGVPHTEVDLVLVDGESVAFGRLLRGGERVAVYPMFERLDVGPVTRLRPRPLRQTRFVLDVHLGKLARYLRLLGFDTSYENDFADAEIVRQSLAEKRIILTRDKGLLKHKVVTHGHWVRATDPHEQLGEIVRAFDLGRSVRPFTRCLRCNGELRAVAKDVVADRVPERVPLRCDVSAQCGACGHVYWRGSHCARLQRIVDEVAEIQFSVGMPSSFKYSKVRS